MALLDIQDLYLEINHLGRRASVLHGVNLRVDAGEIVGLVGETGSGKTLTALSTLRLLPPGGKLTRGKLLFAGVDLVTATDAQVQALRGRSIGLIFQQARAALNPTRPVLQQLADRFIDLRKLPRKAGLEGAIALLKQVGLPEPEVRGWQYPHQLSGGMCQRVMIALAMAAGPKLLLADEPTTGLDVTLQAQILELLTGLAKQEQLAVLLITHDLAMVAESCHRVAVMYAGEVVEEGLTADVLYRPKHPYTVGLVNAVASLEAGQRPIAIPGMVARFQEPPHFCPFAARCPQAFDRCHQERPILHEIEPTRQVACHLYANAK